MPVCVFASSPPALLPLRPGPWQGRRRASGGPGDPTVRLRQAALALVKSLDAGAGAFLESLRLRIGLEKEPELREALVQLVGQLDAQIPPKPLAVGRVVQDEEPT